MKRLKLRLKDAKADFGLFEKFIIIWIYFIVSLNAIDVLSQATLSYFILQDLDDYNKLMYQIIQYQRFFWYLILDFLNGFTLLYLFYQQGIKVAPSRLDRLKRNMIDDNTQAIGARPNYNTQNIKDILAKEDSSLNLYSINTENFQESGSKSSSIISIRKLTNTSGINSSVFQSNFLQTSSKGYSLKRRNNSQFKSFLYDQISFNSFVEQL
ncbi:UNKNOWN [Stylonychia lemnae]|uniref:Transmembrane protein n=1 Tax=Stylonychia lemnae TaxID=5949 RepID=A0A078AS13_STYLE|nr:UNKNOWN [Stylonychia lemnae]|eukprot:CDW83673.1 UNKNOWN [Stylonychia lemnae]